jgi:hypothetical protein
MTTRTLTERFTLASGLSRHRLRRSHPSYGELFCLALGMIVAGYCVGWLHAASVFVEW